MFAGQIYAPQKIKLIDVPEPKLDAPDQIIFQPELGCLCGSDLLYYENDYPEYPSELGHSLHELIGTVLDTNGNKFKVGDRVLCVPVNQRGLYERFAVTEARAIPLIEEPTPPEALMAQPLGTVIYALRKLPNLIDMNVVVVGQGPIGQLFNMAVNNLGAREVIALDKIEGRLATSPKTGATRTINVTQQDAVAMVREITGGKMADLVIEAVGQSRAGVELVHRSGQARRHDLVLRRAASSARRCRVAWRDGQEPQDSNEYQPDFAIDFPLAMRWINERRVDVSPIITHRYGVEQIQDAFDLFFGRREGSLKVLIDFPAGRR